MPLKLGDSAEAMVGIDDRGLVVHWNDAATRLLGRDAESAIGWPCHDVLQGLKPSGGHLCAPNCGIRESCRRLHAPRRFDMVVRHARGHEMWLEVTTVVVFDGDEPVTLHLLTESVEARRLSELAEHVVRRIARVPGAGSNGFGLTRRETDVLGLMAEGLRTAEIAERLKLGETTVRSHAQNLFTKLGVHSRSEAVVFGLRNHLISLRQESSGR